MRSAAALRSRSGRQAGRLADWLPPRQRKAAALRIEIHASLRALTVHHTLRLTRGLPCSSFPLTKGLKKEQPLPSKSLPPPRGQAFVTPLGPAAAGVGWRRG